MPTTRVEIIEESLKNAMGYPEYLQFVEGLVKKGKSSAPDDSEDLAQFSKLNLSRMKRWHKKKNYSEEDFPAIAHYPEKLTWLVISESWCGDAAHSLPVMAELAKLNDHFDLEVVLRDQNKALIDEFLTKGGRSIPKLILYKRESQKIMGSWGPRPNDAAELYADYKADKTKYDSDLNTLLQKWYNKDKGKQTASEIESIFKHL